VEDIPGEVQRREYKVVTQRDSLFAGKFEPERLEHVLNAYAKRGWVVRGVTTASVWVLSGHRDEAMVILEREL
jgi:hypothetical protein